MAKDDALLKRIFKDGAVGEKRKELEENRKREEEEQKELLRRAGEVGALFDECGEIYGKKRYKARVDELIEYLNDKKNNKEHAIEFWKNPHIKMIYNISDHNNFLLSIYTEETDNMKYEEWLRKHFSNPFFTHNAANPIMFKTLANTSSQNYYKVMESIIDRLREHQELHNRYTIFKGENRYWGDTSEIMMKAISGNSLLDVDSYTHLVNTHADLPFYYFDAQQGLRGAREGLTTVEQTITEAARRVNNDEDVQMPQNILDTCKDSFRNIIDCIERIAGSIGGRNQDLPSIRQSLNVIREDVDSLNNLSGLRSMHHYLSEVLVEYTGHYRSEVSEYYGDIYSYNPLILMNNNFLRLDTYNTWRNKFKKYWKEVNQRDPEMFAILDALVKSRKIYLKERKK